MDTGFSTACQAFVQPEIELAGGEILACARERGLAPICPPAHGELAQHEPRRGGAGAARRARLRERTWVQLTKSPEGGWGLDGHANTNADIAAAGRAALAGQ